MQGWYFDYNLSQGHTAVSDVHVVGICSPLLARPIYPPRWCEKLLCPGFELDYGYYRPERVLLHFKKKKKNPDCNPVYTPNLGMERFLEDKYRNGKFLEA
ncbi:uncharacterized protein G2W53_034163 [Senna tora]|uniref:Uncharacterized protein n=1 Tax=Senna tora TaxID=362788 RepID=A0A834W8N5_9FABA|nr:uncharacterized protein G2W53_034163 [Senna tora]